MAGGIPKVLLKLAHKAGAGPISWYPAHMASAIRSIRQRLPVIDLVLEVRDARIPLSSANDEFQEIFALKKRLIVFNKMDLADSQMMHKWKDHFVAVNQSAVFVNAHNKDSVKLMLQDVRHALMDVIEKSSTLLIMVVGIPNVGKSALINAMHIMGHSTSSQGKLMKATVGPLPGVTQHMAGFKIAHRPSIHVLDTPGVMVPKIVDLDMGLKLALTGAVNDSIVGEERLARYLLAMLNGQYYPLRWKKDQDAIASGGANLNMKDGKKKIKSKSIEKPRPRTLLELKRQALFEKKPKKQSRTQRETDHNQDHFVVAVREALASTLTNFCGNLENEDEMDSLVDIQIDELRKALKVPMDLGDKGWTLVAKKLLNLYRIGRLGHHTLDVLPE